MVWLLCKLLVTNNKTEEGVLWHKQSFLTQTHSVHLILYLPELSQPL